MSCTAFPGEWLPRRRGQRPARSHHRRSLARHPGRHGRRRWASRDRTRRRSIGASSRSSRRRTTSTPASQCASPVPDTVMALISTRGRREEEGDRHEVVGRDIGVDEQGESVARGVRRRGWGRGGARAAPADQEHAEQDDDEACAQGDHAYRSFRTETRAARDRFAPGMARHRTVACLRQPGGSIWRVAGGPIGAARAHQSSLPLRARDRAGAPAPRTPRDGSSRYRWCSYRSLRARHRSRCQPSCCRRARYRPAGASRP